MNRKYPLSSSSPGGFPVHAAGFFYWPCIHVITRFPYTLLIARESVYERFVIVILGPFDVTSGCTVELTGLSSELKINQKLERP